jgi:hypothetical protein
MPAEAIRVAGTEAVSCVALTKVVASVVPFQFTVAPETKLVPFTVSVNAPPPGAADAGLRLEMAIAGVTARRMVVASLALADTDPPPDTLTWLVAGDAALAATFTVTVTAG